MVPATALAPPVPPEPHKRKKRKKQMWQTLLQANSEDNRNMWFRSISQATQTYLVTN